MGLIGTLVLIFGGFFLVMTLIDKFAPQFVKEFLRECLGFLLGK